MMEHAPCGGHARSRDNDEGGMLVIDGHGLRHRASFDQTPRSEGVRPN